MLNFVADVVSLATLYTVAYTLYQKNHLIPSVMHEEGFASIMEHCGAYAPLFHALVEYHIPTTLPMKQLHAGTGAFRKTYTLPSVGQSELLRTRMLRGTTPLRRSTARVNNRNLSLSFKLNII